MVNSAPQDKTNAPQITRYAPRALQRPFPWILRYLLSLIPALILAPLVTLPLVKLLRTPLFRQMLETRSLGLLTDILANRQAEAAPGALLLWLPLLAVPLALLIIKITEVFLEGGTLYSYAQPHTPQQHEFWSACKRFFWTLLFLKSWGWISVLISGGSAWMIFAAAGVFPLPWLRPLGMLGFVIAGIFAAWSEVARCVLVSSEQQRGFKALGKAVRVFFANPLPLLVWIIVCSGAYGLLLLAQGWVNVQLPLPWWLATLVAQQLIQVAKLGISLTRQAGIVGWLAQFAPEIEEPLSAPLTPAQTNSEV